MSDWLAANVVKNGIIAALLEIIVQVWTNVLSSLVGSSNATFDFAMRFAYSAGLVQILSAVMFWVFAIGLAIRIVRLSQDSRTRGAAD